MLFQKICFTLLLLAFQFFTAKAQQLQVLLFWSESCPICLFYGPEIRHLQSKYAKETDWTFVFPNSATTDSSAAAYLAKNNLKGKIIRAEAADLVKKYAIEVTPEVILLNASGELLYAGRIDNSYEKIGRRRHKATATELADRLRLVAANQTFAYIRTRAVGCFLHTNP